MIRFVINPIAGFRRSKKDLLQLIRRNFEAGEYDTRLTAGPGDATVLAREAVASGYEAVIAVGGDGTINEVASALVNTDTALGIVPRGSGNGLARGLGIPLQAEAALVVVREAHLRKIDVGNANSRYFFMLTGVGFDASVGEKFNEVSRRGPLPYFVIAAKEFVRYDPETLTVRMDESLTELTPFLITIANTQQFGNGAIIAPRAVPDDGLLDVCVMRPMSVFSALRHAPKLFNGTIDSAPEVSYQQVRSVEIIKAGDILFHVDGEPQRCKSPLKISITPQSLNVMVPRSCRN